MSDNTHIKTRLSAWCPECAATVDQGPGPVVDGMEMRPCENSHVVPTEPWYPPENSGEVTHWNVT